MDAWNPDEAPGRGDSQEERASDPVRDCGDDGEAEPAAIGSLLARSKRAVSRSRVSRGSDWTVIGDDQLPIVLQGHFDEGVLRPVADGVLDEVPAQDPEGVGVDVGHDRRLGQRQRDAARRV